MALSLPNNLSFAPLDVLTADELNQILQNIDFIAEQFPLVATNIGDGAITGAKIADGAITSAKIDYSDAIYSGELSGLDKFTANAWSEKQLNYTSIGITPGHYLVIASTGFVGAGASGDSEFILKLTPSGGTAQRMIQYGSQGLNGATWTTDIYIPNSSVQLAAIYNGVATTSGRWDTVYIRFIRVGNY